MKFSQENLLKDMKWKIKTKKLPVAIITSCK